MNVAAHSERFGSLAILGGRPILPRGIPEGWRPVRLADIWPIVRSLLQGRVTEVHGAETKRVEDGFKRLCGTAHALAMNSGTAALHSAYFAVGVRPGDEVIVPSYTFYATATPLVQLGAAPVFCEIDRRTLTADPDDVERRITRRTRAVCVVHTWGNPAKLDALVDIARRHKIALIEDCSHAHGASFQGQPVGSFGSIGCFSLQGSKAVSGGEAGIAVTNDPVLFNRMLAFGHNGRTDAVSRAAGSCVAPLSYGLKYRPHLFAMHLAASSMARLSEINALRAATLEFLSSRLPADSPLVPIESYPGAIRGGFLEFIFRYRPEYSGQWSREAFVLALREEGVPVAVDRYSHVGDDFLHLHQAPMFGPVEDAFFRTYFGIPARPSVKLPVTECIASRLVTLPAFAKISKRALQGCLDGIEKVAAYARKNPALH